MQINILEYLEQTVKRLPDKTAYADEQEKLSFLEVYDRARVIGSYLSGKGLYKEPVAVFMKKQPATAVAYFGAIYAGCFYVPLDQEMGLNRIEMILEKMKPKAAICDESTVDLMKTLNYKVKIFTYEDISVGEIDELSLSSIRDKAIDFDPIYTVFTSGSTGTPKGVIANHRSVIDYIDNLMEVLKADEDTVFGNQTPFYLDASLKEVLGTIKCGATTYIIPKSHFMFPVKLVECLNEYKINTVCWVVTALVIISSFKVLEKAVPEYLHTIAFGSEVFPIKQFNLWRKHLPDARFINLYGPTEATGMSCYYEVNRVFELDDPIPIGKPFKNTQVLLLNDKDEEAAAGELGEICIRGVGVTLGYYNDLERTREAYVQNPTCKAYPEIIYRTGDLGRYNERGELIFVSRRDYQIKHMGHRIELGEIEVCANTVDDVESACCIYDSHKSRIVLFYTGAAIGKDVIMYLKEKLPRYMVPNHIVNLEALPLTTNGKIDRIKLADKI